MTAEVIQLPRPKEARDPITPLGLYLRIGRNQHRDMLDVLASGEKRFYGLVLEAQYTERHKELRAEALRRGFDVVLDPKTHAMATIGGYSAGFQAVPWALDRPHRTADFEGVEGNSRAVALASFAMENGYTQVLGPTHILQGANDKWLRIDVNMMRHVRDALDAQGSNIPLIYPLAISMQVLRDRPQRQAIIAAVADAPKDAVWLSIENFGSDATGEKTSSYIEAMADFHALGVPIVADHAGGLPGLGLLAFGAVGALAHGITMLESYKISHWRRPPVERESGGGIATRVYIPQLDALMKRADAEAFLNSSGRVRTSFGCRDTHCCPGGLKDTLDHASRHFIHQRSNQIYALGEAPQSVRVAQYLEEHVRKVSDNVAAAAGSTAIAEGLRDKMTKKQGALSRYRQAMGHLAEINPIEKAAAPPQTRAQRGR